MIAGLGIYDGWNNAMRLFSEVSKVCLGTGGLDHHPCHPVFGSMTSPHP